MALLSATQAAKRVGVSIPTVTRAIKNGELSASPREHGKGYDIDTSELERWIQGVTRVTNVTPKSPNTLGDVTPVVIAKLQVELEAERRLLADRTRQLEEMRTERDDWKKQATVLLLNPPPLQPGGIKGVFQRIWSGTSKGRASDP